MEIIPSKVNKAEHHNHNGVGTFIVAVGNSELIADVGGEVYTRRTFSPQRYESNVLNSYGHSVPVIHNQLQWPHVRGKGKEGIYKSDILNTNLSDMEDSMKLDLTRLSIKFKEKVNKGCLKVKVVPAE